MVKLFYFYNYDGEKLYEYFARMSGTRGSYNDAEYIKTFPDMKVLECAFYDSDDINEWVTNISYLNNPEKIYLYCKSDINFKKIKLILNDVFPECEVLNKSEQWKNEETIVFLSEKSKTVGGYVKFVITISLLIVNIDIPISCAAAKCKKSNYDHGMIYKKFMVIYTGCNEKYHMEEYIREFPDCKVL